MYYYIFDVKRCRKKSQIDLIKNQLTSLGISGEYTFITPNQSPELLAENAINKGYNTIVAVGSDDLVNAVANMLIGRKEVLGVLPLSASDELTTLIGCREWQEAIEVLRFRRIRDINTGKIANGKHFLTNIFLNISSPLEVTIEFKNFIMQSTVKNLMISNYHPDIEKKFHDHLDIVVESVKTRPNSFLNKLSSIINPTKEVVNDNISFIRAKSLRIFTKTPTPLINGDKIIAKTPQLIEATDEKIRLIVAKNV